MDNYPMGYEKGLPLRFKWGYGLSPEKQADEFGIIFWGDVNNSYARQQMGEIVTTNPEVADLAKTKKISFWFKFRETNNFSFELYPDLKEKLETSGWIVDNCNKNGVAIIVAEKPDTRPEFSIKEIRELRWILVNFSCIVYGRKLPEERIGRKVTSADDEDMEAVWQKYFADEIFCNYNIPSESERSKGYTLNVTVFASENGLRRTVQILLKKGDVKKLKGGLI